MKRNIAKVEERLRGGKLCSELYEILNESNKTIIEFDFRRIRIMQISEEVIHLARPSASVDNTLLDLHNSSHPAKAVFNNC